MAKVLAAITVLLIFSTASLAQGDWMSFVHKNDAAEFDVDGARKVDHTEALDLLENGAAFVDVRRDIQYKTGHIPNAVGLELKSALTEENLLSHFAKDQQIVFYCSDKQCYRSAHASAMALSWGFTDVVYFAGGWTAWIGHDYPRN